MNDENIGVQGDFSKINWLQEIAKDYLKQQKKQRRNRTLFRVAVLVCALLVFLMAPPKSNDVKQSTPHVAVIELQGGIFDKSPGDAAHFIESLKKVAKNDQVKVLMIDINSPGGSPVQADEMNRALMTFRKAYPSVKVFAYCSDICASAAYYVAVGAEKIYANPSSMVGSIGVVFNGFGFTGAMDKLGVSRRLVTAGKYKGFLDPFSEAAPNEVAKLQTMLNIVHQQFKDAVLQGRGKRLKVNDDTFSGLFWTGIQAKQMGLIDDFASIRDGYGKLPRVVYSARENFIEKLNKQLGESMAHEILNKVGYGNAHIS